MELLLKSIGLTDTAANQLYVGSAVDWLHENTTIVVDVKHPENLKAAVKLFISKFSELMTISTGVASESISGLSQSFKTGQTLEASIYELAIALLGKDAIKTTVTVYSGEDVWDYGS